MTALILLVATLGATAGEIGPAQEPRVTADLTDVAISRAVALVAEQAGLELKVIGLRNDRSISVRLRNTRLHDALDRVLPQLNYTVEWHDDRRAVIRILGDVPLELESPSDIGGAFVDHTASVLDIPDQNPEVLPPEGPGRMGVTLHDIELARESYENMVPVESELVPPELPGERGLTRAEVESLTQTTWGGVVSDAPPVPPDPAGPGWPSASSGRDRLMTVSPASVLDVEVVPPDWPGGRGVTLRQLEQAERPIAPSDLGATIDDFVPEQSVP